MKQYEAVIHTLEQFGGQATLAQLYREVLKVPGVEWKTKTPHASIRRIVQVRPEIFKVRPGLWALEAYRNRLGLLSEDEDIKPTKESIELSHSYYQGLIATIGNLRGFSTFIPNQDKNRICLNNPLSEIRSLQDFPTFSYKNLTNRASTIDVSWFNDRRMPHSFFEIEHSTNIQNSLLKFLDLQDFNTRMIIVASQSRRREFQDKVKRTAFHSISERVAFYDYESLVRDYEHESLKADADFVL
jgi:hypothetical protein